MSQVTPRFASRVVFPKVSKVILDNMLSVRNLIKKALLKQKNCLFSVIIRPDKGKATLKKIEVNKQLSKLHLDTGGNSNIDVNGLNRSRFHLNGLGTGKLAINII